MSKSRSGTRKILEQEMLCESLKGRIQYFMTHYHNAPDQYGRFCVRVDGVERVFANPYNENKLFAYANQLQDERKIPHREWNGKEFLNDVENNEIEDEAARLIMAQGNMDLWQISDALKQYRSYDIQEAIASENEAVRMFAILDRRLGKRSLKKLINQVEQQPEWLQFFFQLRLDAEGINSVKDK